MRDGGQLKKSHRRCIWGVYFSLVVRVGYRGVQIWVWVWSWVLVWVHLWVQVWVLLNEFVFVWILK